LRRALPWVVVAAIVLVVGASITWRFLPEEESESDAKSLSMEVVNGCGMPRVGRAVADELQMRQFNVYTVRAEPVRSVLTTVVDLRDRGGRNARKVAFALSVQRRWKKLPLGPRFIPETRVAIDSSRHLEVRLVVGEDFRRFFPRVVPLY
jgi:hypothetical protein